MKVGEVYKPINNYLKTSSVHIVKIDDVKMDVTYMYLEPFDGKITTSFKSFLSSFELDDVYNEVGCEN